jgi:hypothetical protein
MLGQVGSSSHGPSARKPRNNEKEFFYVYLGFFSAMTVAYQSYHNLGLSTFITLTVALQFLAFSLLTLKVLQTRSVCGISGKALCCHGTVYASRLSSTVWLKGYIPTDSTGEWLYQAMDAMCLGMVLCLLYHVFRRYSHSYQSDKDSFEVGYLLSGCFALAVLLHPHLNNRPMFDTMWTFALYTDVFAMLPQLWMVAKLQGAKEQVEALTLHYLAALSASRCVSMYFWFYAYREFAPKDGSANITGWTIMGAQLIQVCLLLDFAFYYVKACVVKSVNGCLTGDYSQPMDL